MTKAGTSFAACAVCGDMMVGRLWSPARRGARSRKYSLLSRISVRGLYMRPNEFPILRTLEHMKAERSKLSSRGPRFVILHRFWQRETNCMPGEVIAEVLLI